jgi:hypothetical protein
MHVDVVLTLARPSWSTIRVAQRLHKKEMASAQNTFVRAADNQAFKMGSVSELL